MAVLGKIRALGPVALISVIGLALFAFVFSTGSGTVTDVFKADEFNQSRVAVVNGIEMDRTDLMQKVDNIEQQNRGSRSSIQAMNSVWNSELKKLVLQSEYEKIGIQIEREMMRDFLKTNLLAFEDFQDENGEFDETDVKQLINHEAYIHVATTLNGRAQKDMKILGSNYGSITKTQEGLAVFSELITGSIDVDRMRRISDRVVAIQMSIDGADFIEVYKFFLGIPIEIASSM